MSSINTIKSLVSSFQSSNPEVKNDLETFVKWVESNPSPTKSSRPGPGTITGKVWDMCDLLTREGGSKVTRKVALQKGREVGINDSTILTQYQKWSVQYNLTHPVEVKVNPEVVVHPE